MIILKRENLSDIDQLETQVNECIKRLDQTALGDAPIDNVVEQFWRKGLIREPMTVEDYGVHNSNGQNRASKDGQECPDREKLRLVQMESSKSDTGRVGVD